MPNPDTIIAAPGLQPHAESGHDVETWRTDAEAAESLGAWPLADPGLEPGP